MPTCAVHNCRNNRRHGFRLFRFPRGIERREVWKVNSGCFEMKPSSSLCECHFAESAYENRRQDGRRKLRPDAVPTIFSSVGGKGQNIKLASATKPGMNESLLKIKIINKFTNPNTESGTKIPQVDTEIGNFIDEMEFLDDEEERRQELQLENDPLDITNGKSELETTGESILVIGEGEETHDYAKLHEEFILDKTLPQNIQIKILENKLQQNKIKLERAEERNKNLRFKFYQANRINKKLQQRQTNLSEQMKKTPLLKILETRIINPLAPWSPECLEMATKVKLAVGAKTYLYLSQDLGLPLPGYSTICRHVSKQTKNSSES